MTAKRTRIYAVTNQKGGVAKTTTAEALGEGMRLNGQRVLYIDLDPQANLTFTLRAQPSASAFDALTCPSRAAQTITHARADVIAGTPMLASIDAALTSTGKEYRLKEALEAVKGMYDCIMIDTPPALGTLTINALTAAQAVIIPSQADIYSLKGVEGLKDTIATIRKYTNASLKVDGLLLTRYNGRTLLAKEITEAALDVARAFRTRVYATRIRECIALKEAQLKRQSIYEYAPDSNGAKDYTALLEEMQRR